MKKVKENKTTCTFPCIYISCVLKNEKIILLLNY